MTDKLLNFLFVAVCGNTLLLGGESPASVERHQQYSYNLAQHTKIHWENGRLLAVDFLHDSAVVLDESGNVSLQSHIALPGAVRVSVNDLALSSSGSAVAAVTAFGIEGVAASFLVWLDSLGAITKAVRLAPFAPMRICFAPDGTLWAAGREHDTQYEDVSDHHVIRHFDTTGKLIGSFLPVTSFFGTSRLQHPGVLSHLSAHADRIGFYSGGTHEWIEMSQHGDILGRWKGMAEDVSGVAFSVHNDVVVTILPAKPGVPVMYRLDKGAGVWRSVPAEGTLSVLGADGDNIVTISKGNMINWLPIEPNRAAGGLSPNLLGRE